MEVLRKSFLLFVCVLDTASALIPDMLLETNLETRLKNADRSAARSFKTER